MHYGKTPTQSLGKGKPESLIERWQDSRIRFEKLAVKLLHRHITKTTDHFPNVTPGAPFRVAYLVKRFQFQSLSMVIRGSATDIRYSGRRNALKKRDVVFMGRQCRWVHNNLIFDFFETSIASKVFR